jgi:hypothetical protein
MGLFGLIHALGGSDANCYFLSKEIIDESPCDFTIKSLLRLRVKLKLLWTYFNKLFEGISVDVVIHLAPDHTLIHVKSLNIPSSLYATFIENLL